MDWVVKASLRFISEGKKREKRIDLKCYTATELYMIFWIIPLGCAGCSNTWVIVDSWGHLHGIGHFLLHLLHLGVKTVEVVWHADSSLNGFAGITTGTWKVQNNNTLWLHYILQKSIKGCKIHLTFKYKLRETSVTFHCEQCLYWTFLSRSDW